MCSVHIHRRNSVMSYSRRWLALGVYNSILTKNNKFVKKWQEKGKGFRRPRAANCGEVNIQGKLIEQGLLVQIYLGANFPSSSWPQGFLRRGNFSFFRSPHFSEVSAISQIRKPPRRLLSASADSHFPLTQNSPNAKVAYLGRHIWIPHSIFRTWFSTLS